MITLEELERLERLHAEATGRTSARWVLGKEREDGTAQVYAPNRGPMRVVVPIAETTREDGEALVALYCDAPRLFAASRDAHTLAARVEELEAEVREHKAVRSIKAERLVQLEDEIEKARREGRVEGLREAASVLAEMVKQTELTVAARNLEEAAARIEKMATEAEESP